MFKAPKVQNIYRPRNSIASTTLTRSSLASAYGTPTWYHNLPVSVLINIFQYFDEKYLSENISLVCKRWRYASNRPELWKKLEFYGKDVPITYICRKIRDLTYLESVRVDNIVEPVSVIRQIYRCNPNIKHVAIRNCFTIPETALRSLIQRCKKLESLDLSGTKFRANRFYEEIAGLINLKSVNLSKNSWLSVKNLLSVVLNCHKLEELQLSSFCPLKPLQQLSDEDASFIISNLAPNLRVLTLDASTLTNFSFRAIMNCNKLEQLGLYGAGNLSPDVFTRIWERLPNLKILKIRHAHQITGQHIVELFELGKNVMQQIVLIDFTGCWKITDVGIEAMANCCENLQTLILKSCKNVHSLQPISEKCLQLQKLNIAFCTNLDCKTVLPLLKSIKKLIIDRSYRFSGIVQDLNTYKTKICIKLCLSEYNREMENYTFNII